MLDACLHYTLPFNVDGSCAGQFSTLPLPLRFNVVPFPPNSMLKSVALFLFPNLVKASIPYAVSCLNIESEGQGECGELTCTGTINIEWEGVVRAGIRHWKDLLWSRQNVFSLFVRCMDSAIEEKVGGTSTM